MIPTIIRNKIPTVKLHGANKHDNTTWYAVITPRGALLPDTNPAELELITGTNFTYYVLDFDPDTAEIVFAQFKLPPNYVAPATIYIIIQWISTAIINDVKWGAQILGRADGEAYDVALGAEQTVTTTTDGVAGRINTSVISIGSPAISAEDIFVLRIRRIAADGADTMTVDARTIMASVQL